MRNPGYDSNIELRPEGATLARHAASHRASERHVVHPISMAEGLLGFSQKAPLRATVAAKGVYITTFRQAAFNLFSAKDYHHDS